MVFFLITVLLRFDKLTDFVGCLGLDRQLTSYNCECKQSRTHDENGEVLVGQSYHEGIFVASTPVLSGAEWLVISGPIFLSWLLLFVSGIQLLEKSADKRFSGMEECRLYKKTTSTASIIERYNQSAEEHDQLLNPISKVMFWEGEGTNSRKPGTVDATSVEV